MTKQTKAVRAWAVCYTFQGQPVFNVGTPAMLFESKRRAELYRGDKSIVPVLITTATPKRRSRK